MNKYKAIGNLRKDSSLIHSHLLCESNPINQIIHEDQPEPEIEEDRRL